MDRYRPRGRIDSDLGIEMGYGCRELYQRERERERERASSEKMRTKNGFRFSQRERERELYQKRKRELYRKNENARIIKWSVEEIIKKLKKLII